ncbi:hypothetical protein L484_023868 [Morus notabilis]|uniref:Uncharacterized protein n=1 Tax=Morus notabilis TaxID=981085 RepID=W9R565_9ROSA|nr:hypothetical protein L484_023868 [Morus notabilis]
MLMKYGKFSSDIYDRQNISTYAEVEIDGGGDIYTEERPEEDVVILMKELFSVENGVLEA